MEGRNSLRFAIYKIGHRELTLSRVVAPQRPRCTYIIQKTQRRFPKALSRRLMLSARRNLIKSRPSFGGRLFPLGLKWNMPTPLDAYLPPARFRGSVPLCDPLPNTPLGYLL